MSSSQDQVNEHLSAQCFIAGLGPDAPLRLWCAVFDRIRRSSHVTWPLHARRRLPADPHAPQPSLGLVASAGAREYADAGRPDLAGLCVRGQGSRGKRAHHARCGALFTRSLARGRRGSQVAGNSGDRDLSGHARVCQDTGRRRSLEPRQSGLSGRQIHQGRPSRHGRDVRCGAGPVQFGRP
jgi:hypothetical protein